MSNFDVLNNSPENIFSKSQKSKPTSARSLKNLYYTDNTLMIKKDMCSYTTVKIIFISWSFKVSIFVIFLFAHEKNFCSC